MVWSIIGDHEYFSNTLGLPHLSSHYPCWECDAENFTPCTFGKGYKEICLEKQKFDVYTNENCLVDPWSDHSLFKVPGTSSCMVRGDPLHVLLCKVLYSHLMGGILHYLCYYEGPGVRTAKKPTERLPVLFSQVQVHYTQQQCKNMLTNLRLSMICASHGQSILFWIARVVGPDTCPLLAPLSSNQFLQAPQRSVR